MDMNEEEMSIAMQSTVSNMQTNVNEMEETSTTVENSTSDVQVKLDEIPEASTEVPNTTPDMQAESIEVDNNSEAHVEECTSVLTKSKHKTGFNEVWRETYPWVSPVHTNEKSVLFCSLCTKWHKDCVTYNNSPWIKNGYLTVRLDKLREHSNSAMHKKAISYEANKNMLDECSEKDLETNSELVAAIESAMKCMNFLIKHNLPHHSLFEPLINFCIDELKSPVLLPLKKAKNCNYTSHRTVDEFLEIMAKTKEDEILEEIKSSPCFSVSTDETCDVTNRKHMAIAIKYLKDGSPKVSFVKDCHLSDGKSETIFAELLPVIEEYGGFKKMVGFSSDGARAMVGAKNGVATMLKEKNESLIAINCMNHRLALATKDSFEAQKRFIKLDEILNSTYKYYKYSASRTNSLINAQSLFCSKGTTLKRVGFTRWLSHQKAVNSIRLNYEAILNDLENTVSNGESCNISGPTASALLKSYKSFDYFQGIHFLCDVLNVVGKLNIIFQTAETDISCIQPNVDNTLAELRRLKKKPGGTFSKNIDNKARSLGIIAPIGENDSFQSDAREFLEKLTENISSRMQNSDIIAQLSVLDLRKVSNSDIDITTYGNAEVIELSELFKLDEDKILEEWSEYKEIFLKHHTIDSKKLSINKIYSTILETEKVNGEVFPLLKIPLTVACTLPVSNAEVERIFSQLKLVLTDRRSHLKFKHVNQLMVLKLNDTVNLKSVVSRWVKLKSRRIFS